MSGITFSIINIKKKVASDIKEIRAKLRAVAAAAETIPYDEIQATGIVSHAWANEDEVFLSVPFDENRRKKIHRILVQAGWHLFKLQEIDCSGDLRARFAHTGHPGVQLVVDFDPTKPGATCRREVVGERKVPVYKIICD